MTDIYSLLKLISIPGLGSKKITNLISKYGSPENVLCASNKELLEVKGINNNIAKLIKNHNGTQFADKQLSLLEKHNAKIITLWDDNYPEQLKNIYDPPAILFASGEFKECDYQSLAVVGSRRLTSYGKQTAALLSRELTQSNFVVISGFARGVDSAAHRAVCENNGRTVAVLGCGLDILYPPENGKLRDTILEKGLFISEFPFGTPPNPGNFPMRNRIISGLSLGVLVIEAAKRSGALITALLALDQGKEVFAVPGSIFNEKSKGCNGLIKKGAKLVESIDDITEELSALIHVAEKEEKQLSLITGLSKDEQEIWEHLTEEIHIDNLSAKLNKPTSKVLSTLLMMELNNIVRQLPGKVFIRN